MGVDRTKVGDHVVEPAASIWTSAGPGAPRSALGVDVAGADRGGEAGEPSDRAADRTGDDEQTR